MAKVGSSGSGFGHTLLLVGVLLSLCFSVGEGVRLLPFPMPAVEARGADASEFLGGECFSPPGHHAGQMDVPVKVQKRSKRQTDYCGAALRPCLIAHVLPRSCSSGRGSAAAYSHTPAALRPGRAPPPAS